MLLSLTAARAMKGILGTLPSASSSNHSEAQRHGAVQQNRFVRHLQSQSTEKYLMDLDVSTDSVTHGGLC